ncbi:MAG TPA: bifunctional UDP-N-acetylmuramoyl-tripeptide:D-alanyl-D-alanine ligase/alanine racemase [Salinivirga sp.]|uniref:bifunctional UDP-N-acetylmuramoyl-tripeptide:D-alanyl-D-alanine ligase/alanine racemase n=1 Tax=Salinivirga sp. TaxID=1970192 RepID=UPI002B46A058|nr:bifunctional UDP-N-acetylmuramoyl-tripeptide:D-alanyl-D-alanine ligase/alanine racemase [Salinivirga sp.]HKK58110.1 bifunctional UDP-N-acetylmuramoyl-tripeptide:D-alanyl-D-alanine ligase/alanine racemase [Salinivirga sp.]
MVNLKKVAEISQGECVGSCSGQVKYLLTDSRKLTLPEQVLFFAIPGKYHNGHAYIPALIKKGVRQFVVSELPEKQWLEKADFVKVHDVISALQSVAAWWRSHFSLPVIGVTGSNGKTIVKEWIAQSLGDIVRMTRTPGSYNSQIGVPLSVWMLSDGAQFGLFEAGISFPGEMEKLQTIIKPTIGLFTNLGDAHQENFSSFTQKLEEKLRLFKNADVVIYRNEGDWVSEKIEAYCTERKKFTWSFKEEADVKAHLDDGVLKVQYSNQKLSLSLPFSDKASVENLMHTITVLCYLGYDSDFIYKAVAKIRPVPMRLEQKSGKAHNTIINDSYNSDLGSLSNALDFLEQQKQHPRKVLVLSDIFQSGYAKENLYKEVSVLVNAHKPDLMLGVGKDLMQFRELFHLDSHFFKSTTELIAALGDFDFTDTTVLLKGSRSFHFEEVDKILEEKSHRTVLEVNLNALTHNLNYFKSLLKHDADIIVMVKAFSYGSGSHEIANVLQYHRVAYLAVAFADEGVDLRARGIDLPIMVMNPHNSDFDSLVRYRLEPVVFDYGMLSSLGKYLVQQGERRFPVHIKLNTGMNRSGFNPSDIDNLIDELKKQPAMYVQTAFSHLASSDEPMHDNFTHDQARVYNTMCKKLALALDRNIKKHLLNSAGIERFHEYQFDYVRLGIGLYGISVADADLKQVGRLRTSIAQIRDVMPGETVGYGRSGEVDNPKKIATIPIGYADGFRRILSNGRGKVFINGNLYPVIGNVCMDMTMIDITGAKVEVGDEVIIFGPELPIEEVAGWLETIPYEVLTSVAARVKRIYVKD